MNEIKNQQLAIEITKFCQERVKSPASISNSSKSLLHALLIVLLAAPLNSASGDPDKKILW